VRFVKGHNARGAVSPSWRGDEVSYSGLHHWLRSNWPVAGVCELCGAEPTPAVDGRARTNYANVSGEYRRNRDDYLELCVPCHRRFDAASA